MATREGRGASVCGRPWGCLIAEKRKRRPQMVSCSDACWFLAAANGNPRPHASRTVGQKVQPSSPSAICDGSISMRCDTVCIWLDTPGAAQVSIPFGGCCHSGAEHPNASRGTGPPVLELEIPVQYTPWRLVMRAALLCCVAHTGTCMEYMRPHMPLKQGAYEHVRIRYVLRVRTVAFAPYIGNPAASRLSLGPTYIQYRQRSAVSHVQSNGPCWVSFEAGEMQRTKLDAGQSVEVL